MARREEIDVYWPSWCSQMLLLSYSFPTAKTISHHSLSGKHEETSVCRLQKPDPGERTSQSTKAVNENGSSHHSISSDENSSVILLGFISLARNEHRCGRIEDEQENLWR